MRSVIPFFTLHYINSNLKGTVCLFAELLVQLFHGLLDLLRVCEDAGVQLALEILLDVVVPVELGVGDLARSRDEIPPAQPHCSRHDAGQSHVPLDLPKQRVSHAIGP